MELRGPSTEGGILEGCGFHFFALNFLFSRYLLSSRTVHRPGFKNQNSIEAPASSDCSLSRNDVCEDDGEGRNWKDKDMNGQLPRILSDAA